MRTTIRMNKELARRAKDLAARTGKSFTEVVESAILHYLADQSSPRPRRRIKLPVSKARGKPLTHEQAMALIRQADLECDLKKIGLPVR